LYGAAMWTLRKVDQKYLESFEMWCWTRMEIIWTDHVKNEELLHRIMDKMNFLHTIKQRKASWAGHILCRNCLLRLIIEGKTEGTGRQGRRCTQLLNEVTEARRY
jgi:hypothetical protein